MNPKVKAMFKIIQKRKYFYVVSLIVILPGIIFVALGGLKLGIDFTGGTVSEYDITQKIDETIIQDAYTHTNIDDVVLNTLGNNRVRVTSRELTQDEHKAITSEITQQNQEINEVSFASIGPTIGNELRQKAIVATILVVLFIVLYITWAFRKSSSGSIKSWVFGASALIALMHDLLIVVGVFAILGYFTNVRIDVLFVTSLLTVLGFSVHDSIVVFDRVRERMKLHDSKQTFEDVVNQSVSQTLIRSLATSLTTVLVLTTLLLFGGESIRFFVIALLIGMTAGTYSSICIASPLLVSWDKYRTKKYYNN